MSCSANSDLPMNIGIRIQSANTVLTQSDTALISDKSFGAVCRSTYVQAVSLDPIAYILYVCVCTCLPGDPSSLASDRISYHLRPRPSSNLLKQHRYYHHHLKYL